MLSVNLVLNHQKQLVSIKRDIYLIFEVGDAQNESRFETKNPTT